jgi:hypothetical protein
VWRKYAVIWSNVWELTKTWRLGLCQLQGVMNARAIA